MMRLCRVWVKRFTALSMLALIAIPPSVDAQSMRGTGIVPTGLLLRQLDGVKRVLIIGAHPDDEDTSLLTALARGWGVEVAYLALTRGDGGQNLIGPELWEGLGVIRTGELEAARTLDGGQQFFTRAFDYGFSKSADEALSLWSREELLEDVTWVVRKFRPHVIVSEFSGTPRDGHGQHQASGIISREVFEAAGDRSRFTDQFEHGVEPWRPAKLYETSRRRFFGGRGGTDDDITVIDTGSHDPLLGRSLFQLAMESRSQHRSQDMGAPQPFGPQDTGLTLVDTHIDGSGDGMFSGIDTTLVGITARLDSSLGARVLPHLEAYRASVTRARGVFGLNPSAIVPDLAEALEHLVLAGAAAGTVADQEFMIALAKKRTLATQALMAASAVTFDVRVADDLLVPGQAVQVQAHLWNGGDFHLTNPMVDLEIPEAWEAREMSVSGLSANGEVMAGTLATWTFDLIVSDNADLSRLYFLREDRDGPRYRWPDEPDLWGMPRDPAPVRGKAVFSQMLEGESMGGRVETVVPWRYVGVDPSFGEFEKPVLVVPGVSVAVTPGGIAWPQDQTQSRSISVIVRSQKDEGARGEVRLVAPQGWMVTPADHSFDLRDSAAERTLEFTVQPQGELSLGDHAFQAVVRTDDDNVYTEGFALIDYEHIPRSPLYSDAELAITVFPVAATPGLRVGYIMGSGDDGPEAIRQLGVEVEVLDENTVRSGSFGSYDVLVLGVRAYEVRPDLRAASAQVLDFSRAGGTVLVQYNRGSLGSLAPQAIQVGRGSPRVSDETVEVTLLAPSSPAFTTPNQITQFDFEGWVQERGLYFAASWDNAYVPLLEMNDPGEEARHGSLLVATVEEGLFIYTGLAFFRQWASRVPGAYRLFANLISLEPAAWMEFTRGN